MGYVAGDTKAPWEFMATLSASLVIPVRASIESLEGVVSAATVALARAYGKSFEIIVVPNGPDSEETARAAAMVHELARRFAELRVVESKAPGKGLAIATGVRASRGNVLFFTDADLPYDLNFIDRAATALEGGAHFVTGNRRLGDSTMQCPIRVLPLALWRHGLGRCLNVAVRALFGIETTDTQAGIKAMTRDFATAVFSRARCPGFFGDLEYFLVCRDGGFRHVELAVDLTLRHEKTTVQVFREFRALAAWMPFLLFLSVLGYYGGARQRQLYAWLRVSGLVLANAWGGSWREWLTLNLRWFLTPYWQICLALPESGKIVDLGSGHGLLAIFAALSGPERQVQGVDLDNRRLTMANRAARDAGVNATFSRGDLRAGDTSEARAIVLLDVLHYLPRHEQEALLRRHADSMAPGGILVMREPVTDGGPSSAFNLAYERARVRSGFTQTASGAHGQLVARPTGDWLGILGRVGFAASVARSGLPIFADRLFVARRIRDLKRPALAAAVTADDWGLSPGINEGILELARTGIVRRVSVLAEAPHAAYRLRELKEVSGIELGLHFNLTYPFRAGETWFSSRSRLVTFLLDPRLSRSKKRTAVAEALARQVAALRGFGVEPAYVDGHHHVHVFPGVTGVVSAFLKKQGIRTMRLPYERRQWISQRLWLNVLALSAAGTMRRAGLAARSFVYPTAAAFRRPERLLAGLAQSNDTEVLVHPALVDDLGAENVDDSYRAERVREFHALHTASVDTSKEAAPRPGLTFMLATTAVVMAAHFAYWARLLSRRGETWTELLLAADAGWYDKVVAVGHTGLSWAYYPLYPALIRGIQIATGQLLPAAITGTIVATACTFLAITLMAVGRNRTRRAEPPAFLAPDSYFGWLLLVLTPASWAFHSFHTEGLFLLLTVAAVTACAERRVVATGIFAGLAALTKNQGVLLAVALAGWSAFAPLARGPDAAAQSKDQKGWSARWQNFVTVGLISASMYAAWPLFQYLQTGDPLRFLHVQASWHPAPTAASITRAFWLGNPWQSVTVDSLGRLATFWIITAGGLVVARRNIYLGGYIVAFMALEALTGEFVGTLRYATVLFPAYFVLGDAAAKRLPWPVKLAILALLLQCNRFVTWSYGVGAWGY